MSSWSLHVEIHPRGRALTSFFVCDPFSNARIIETTAFLSGSTFEIGNSLSKLAIFFQEIILSCFLFNTVQPLAKRVVALLLTSLVTYPMPNGVETNLFMKLTK